MRIPLTIGVSTGRGSYAQARLAKSTANFNFCRISLIGKPTSITRWTCQFQSVAAGRKITILQSLTIFILNKKNM